jgi:hypothetical protein
MQKMRLCMKQPDNAVKQGEGIVIEFPGAGTRGGIDISLSPSELQTVKTLRRLLGLSLLGERFDVEQACMLIAADRDTTIERYAAAFFHGIETYAKRNLHFFTVKSESVSDDEMWLLRLLEALRDEDYISARYLMALRIEPAGHRRLMFLAGGLAKLLFAETAEPHGNNGSNETRQTPQAKE